MAMKLWNRIKEAAKILFSNKDDVLRKFNIKTLPDFNHSEYVRYQKIVDGKADWNNENSPSLMLANGIDNKITNKTFVEFECAITAGTSGSPNLDSKGRLIYDKQQRYTRLHNSYTDFLNNQLQDFIKNIKMADKRLNDLGKILIKCTTEGNKIITHICTPNEYAPISYSASGELTAVLLWYSFNRDNCVYTLYEYSNYDAIRKTYTIQYAGYKQEQYAPARETPLTDVEEWSYLQPTIQYKNIEHPFFIEIQWLDGKPLYYPAIENIKQADIVYGLALREYKTGAMSVVVDYSMVRPDNNGNPVLPDAHERNYFVTKDSSDEGHKIETISPDLRDDHYLKGIDYIARIIETNIGISHGTISDPNQRALTATEIQYNLQETLVTVGIKQALWSDALQTLCSIYDELAHIYGFVKPSKWELTTSWGDGIKESDGDVFNRMMLAAQQDMLHGVYITSWLMGVSQDEAYLMMPEIEESEVETDPYSPTASAVQAEVEQTSGKQLNGAQTQSLIAVIGQYTSGALTLGQAINIISAAIGVSKEEAQKIIEGAV